MKKLQSSLRNMILVLVSAALLMGGILAWVNHVTEGPIALQAEKTLATGIKTVMGGEKLTVVGTDTITIDDTSYLGEIVHDLKKYGTVEVDLDMCIICVVGDMNWENLGFETAVLEAMKDIPVRMVSYGGSNYNISLLVKEQDKVRALRALSAKLF